MEWMNEKEHQTHINQQMNKKKQNHWYSHLKLNQIDVNIIE